MAGICGIFNRAGDRSVFSSELEAMHAADPDRGPQGFTAMTAGSVGLGHQHFSPWNLRPSISLPFRNGTVLLSCDTRLDDRKTLQKELDFEAGERPSDSELILAAYARWDLEFPRHLEGDFAVILYDEAKNRFMACRDRLGVRDLAYSLSGDRCVIASTPAEVAAAVGAEINEGRLAEFLGGLFYNGEESFLKNISYLPPGACLMVHPQTYRLSKYWELEPEPAVTARPDEEIVDEFLDLLRNSVKARMQGSERIGVSLSGGPDSAALAALASETGGSSPVAAFSYIFPSYPSCDEKHYIDQVLKHLGLEGRFLNGDTLWPLSDFENWPVFPDFPSQDPYVRLPLQLCRIAASEGINVLLNGHFADLLFRGGRYWAAEQLSRPFSLLASLVTNFRGLDWRGDLLSRGIGTRIPQPLMTIVKKTRHRGTKNFPMLEPGWVDACNLRSRLEAQEPAAGRGRRDHLLRARHLQMPLIPQGTSAARRLHNKLGVEIVDPFWDRKLMEFISRTPADLLARPRISKWLLRKSIEGKIPAEVVWRPDKTSLHELFRQGLMIEERKKVLGIFGNSELLARGFLNREWLDTELSGGEGRQDSGFALWRCIQAELWVRNLCRQENQATLIA